MVRFERWDVDFPVWDAVSDLATDPGGVMSMYESHRAGDLLNALGIHRGAEMLGGESLTTWSFRPSSLLRDRYWHLHSAILEFVPAISDLEGRDAGSVARELFSRSNAESAEPTVIMLGEKRVDGIRVNVRHGGWAVATLNPGFGMACCGSGVDIPEFRLIDSFSDQS